MPYSSLYIREPRWRTLRFQAKLPATVQSWVYETGSLTQRLRHRYGPTVSVKILHQGWQTPTLSERQRLALPPHRRAWVREVLLHTDRQPLILASTVIPITTLQTTHGSLTHLGTRPLGEVIFSYKNRQRLYLELSSVRRTHWKNGLQKITGEQTWGRRIVYTLDNRPMIVAEWFLPQLVWPDA